MTNTFSFLLSLHLLHNIDIVTRKHIKEQVMIPLVQPYHLELIVSFALRPGYIAHVHELKHVSFTQLSILVNVEYLECFLLQLELILWVEK